MFQLGYDFLLERTHGGDLLYRSFLYLSGDTVLRIHSLFGPWPSGFGGSHTPTWHARLSCFRKILPQKGWKECVFALSPRISPSPVMGTLTWPYTHSQRLFLKTVDSQWNILTPPVICRGSNTSLSYLHTKMHSAPSGHFYSYSPGYSHTCTFHVRLQTVHAWLSWGYAFLLRRAHWIKLW